MKMEVRSGKHSLTRFISGIVLIMAALLILLHHKNWFMVVMFMGASHIFSATHGFCIMEKILYHIFRMPVRGKD